MKFTKAEIQEFEQLRLNSLKLKKNITLTFAIFKAVVVFVFCFASCDFFIFG